MSLSSKSANVAVALASVPMAWGGETMNALFSTMLGLSGVALARTVFINREVRQTGQRLHLSDTLPLTLTAMLITGVIIWDRQLGLSMSVFTGLGVGWTAILLLDVVGAGVLNVLRRSLGQPPAIPEPPKQYPENIPPDIERLLRKLDGEKDREI